METIARKYAEVLRAKRAYEEYSADDAACVLAVSMLATTLHSPLSLLYTTQERRVQAATAARLRWDPM